MFVLATAILDQMMQANKAILLYIQYGEIEE